MGEELPVRGNTGTLNIDKPYCDPILLLGYKTGGLNAGVISRTNIGNGSTQGGPAHIFAGSLGLIAYIGALQF